MNVVTALLMAFSLAACTGLRTFLPLLALGAAARLHYLPLQPSLAWMASTEALIVFGVAAVLEILADKVPGLDHVLDVFHTFARPAAGTLVAMGAFSQLSLSPAYDVALALIVGAPVAGAFHLTRASTRVASSTLTVGMGNPFLSLAEDAAALVGTALSLVAPIVAGILVLCLAVPAIRWLKARRATRA